MVPLATGWRKTLDPFIHSRITFVLKLARHDSQHHQKPCPKRFQLRYRHVQRFMHQPWTAATVFILILTAEIPVQMLLSFNRRGSRLFLLAHPSDTSENELNEQGDIPLA